MRPKVRPILRVLLALPVVIAIAWAVAWALRALLLAGLFYFSSFDRGEAVAKDLLLRPDQLSDFTALASALAAKYPDGSPSSALTGFVTGHGGSCNETPASLPERLSCRVQVSGTFCAADGFHIDARLSPRREVSNISVRHGSWSC